MTSHLLTQTSFDRHVHICVPPGGSTFENTEWYSLRRCEESTSRRWQLMEGCASLWKTIVYIVISSIFQLWCFWWRLICTHVCTCLLFLNAQPHLLDRNACSALDKKASTSVGMRYHVKLLTWMSHESKCHTSLVCPESKFQRDYLVGANRSVVKSKSHEVEVQEPWSNFSGSFWWTCSADFSWLFLR